MTRCSILSVWRWSTPAPPTLQAKSSPPRRRCRWPDRLGIRCACCRITRCWPGITSWDWSRSPNRRVSAGSPASRVALEAAVLVAEHSGAKCVDTRETRRHRLAVDVAGREAVGQHPGYGLIEVPGGQLDRVAVDVYLLRHLGGGHAGEARRAQRRLGIVEHHAALLLESQHVPRDQRRVGGGVAHRQTEVPSFFAWSAQLFERREIHGDGVGGRAVRRRRAGTRVLARLCGRRVEAELGRVGGGERLGYRVDDRFHRVLADRPLTGGVLGQRHREVAATLLDLLLVDARARARTVGKP